MQGLLNTMEGHWSIEGWGVTRRFTLQKDKSGFCVHIVLWAGMRLSSETNINEVIDHRSVGCGVTHTWVQTPFSHCEHLDK